MLRFEQVYVQYSNINSLLGKMLFKRDEVKNEPLLIELTIKVKALK